MAPVLGSASSSAWSRWSRIETPQRGDARDLDAADHRGSDAAHFSRVAESNAGQ